MTRRFRPRRLAVEQGLDISGLTGRLSDPDIRVEVAPEITPADYARYGRDTLIYARHKGAFVKPCPGTRDYICCGLQIIHFGLGCSLDCSYCVLKSYLNTNALALFGNVDEGLRQVRLALNRPGRDHKRYCTGEFMDSLLLEDISGSAAALVELFSEFPDAVLELKTKTDQVDSLAGLNHRGRTVVSFSMNAPDISRTEEVRAAPLELRLAAAVKMINAGYRVGFHFDPLIRHDGWREGYSRTVADIYQAVPAGSIAWISLGAFRYLPAFKEIIRSQNSRSRIMNEEFIPAPDGKMRYLRPRRVEMYRHLLTEIRKADPDACVYLCMESPRVWQEVFGFDPGPRGLIDMLDQRV